ncbi:MAG: HYR domain-containing protein, partial [Bacteroidetes bacterium]|nr:HYR domain-containing protein [Bacteroidota bacterium]
MKKTTWLWLSVIAACFTLQVGAQNATSLTDAVSLGTIPDVNTTSQLGAPAVITHTDGFAITATYTDRTAFQAATGGMLTFEDFEGGPTPGTLLNCGGEISSAGDGCFPAGEIQPGITIVQQGSPGNTLAIGTGWNVNTHPIVGCNNFGATLLLTFTNGDVDAFGFDLYTLFNATTAEIRIFGTSGLIDTFSVTTTNPSFFGAVADEIITSVEIQDTAGNEASEIGLLEFGTANTPPTITCPMDIVLNASPNTCGAVVGFTPPLVTDNEDDPAPAPVQTAGPASGSEFPVGVTTVEFSATDSNGATSTCSFTVTINDAEAPMAVCQDITVQLDASGQYVMVASEIDGGSTDNCAIASIAVGGGIPPVTGTGNAPLLIPFDGDAGSESGPMDPSIAPIADAGIIGVDYTLDNVMFNAEHTWADDLEV